VATVLVLVVGFVATGALARWIDASQDAQAQEQSEQVAGQLERQLETSIIPAAQISDALDSYVRGEAGNLRTVRVREFMKGLNADGLFVRSITLAPDNRIRYVEPLRGNEAAVGLYLPGIPEQWAPVEAIIESGEPGLTGPFELAQGGLGMAYRHPIELPFTGYWGLGSVVIDADAYLADAAAIPGVALDRVALRTVAEDGVPGEVFWGNPQVFEDGTVSEVRPLGATWQLAVVPEETESPVSLLVRVLGYVTTAILAALVFLTLRSRQRRREASDRLANLSALVPGMLYQMRVAQDGSTAVPYASAGITDLFGFAPDEVAADASPMWDRVDPADAPATQASMMTAVEDGTRWHHRLRMRNGAGQTRWFLADATAEPDPPDGVMLHGLLTDVTDEVEMAEQMRISASVFASTRDGIIIMSPDGRILDVNAGFTAITGYGLDEVRGETLEVLGSGLTPQDVYDDVRQSLDRDGFWRGELVNRTRTGQASAAAVSITTVRGETGDISHFVAVISALSTLRDDLVTGLPGRQMVDDRLAQAVERARASGGRAALLIVGLDRFRDINESAGHRVGDLVLKTVGQRLRRLIHEPETVARLGGDEFAVILSEDASPAAVEGAASSIVKLLSQPMAFPGRTVHLTCSIGIAVFPDDSTTAADLLLNADQAIRAAKDSGRDRYSYSTSAMQDEARERMRLTEDLRSAIARDELRMVFQPVVDMPTRRVLKAEALVRWTHPELGPMSPARFIPLAEASGQIKEIGDWIFDRILEVLVAARQVDPDFTIGFNLSPVEIIDPHDLHTRRLRLIEERGIPGSALVAEITEGMLLDRGDETTRNLRAYRDAGLEFAIDDFGTGYSSLSYLQKLDVDYLKIDQSFVSGLAEGNESHALCLAIIDMAHALHLRVIAEGVETDEHWSLLLAGGCDFGQGYLFSRPIPPEELLAMITAQRPSM
jgi:diguanylate cyclase (GGDEF)-like protein/PAS domain S-box-containing protein